MTPKTPKAEDTEQFEDISFPIRPEKIGLLQQFCKDHGIDPPVMIVNLPISAKADFDRFLIEQDILAED